MQIDRFSRKSLFKLGWVFSLGFEIWPVAGVVVSTCCFLLPEEVVLKDRILLQPVTE